MTLSHTNKFDARGWFARERDWALNGFAEAAEDAVFLDAITADDIIDVRLAGDERRPFSPAARSATFSEEILDFVQGSSCEPADLVVLPRVLQRSANPFRLLRAAKTLVRPGGRVVISVPLRDAFQGGHPLPAPHPHRRTYTLASLFLEVQAAWGFNSFRVRFVREYDDISADRPASNDDAFSLIFVLDAGREHMAYPAVPRIEVKRAPDVVNPSADEALMAVDLSQVLSPSLSPADVKRVCILKLDHIGDFVMALGAFDEVKAAFPSAEITCVCGSWNEPLARSLDCFDEVIACDYYAHNGPNSASVSALAAQRLADHFAGQMFDIAFDLRVPADSRQLLEIIPARVRAGIGNAEMFPFLDVALPAFDAFSTGLDTDFEASEMFFPVDSFAFRGAVASPSSFRVLRARSDQGEFLFGPYVPVARGAYRATWLLSSLSDVVSVDVDVTSHDAVGNLTRVLRQAVIEVGESGPQQSVEFELLADVDRVEFRARVPADHEEATLLFTGVRLERLSGRPTSRHMARAQVHMKEQMSLLLALVRTRLFSPPRSLHDIRKRLGVVEGRPATPFFAIAPFSNSELRNWPLEGFKALCALILSETTASVRLIGSMQQHAELQAFITDVSGGDGAGRIQNCAGNPWEEVYTSLVQADAVIANNSGMAHVAAALGAQVIAIYSGSHQLVEWGPLGPRVTGLQASLPCGACGFDTMPECLHGHRCMQIIDPGAVLQTLRTVSPASFRTEAEAPEHPTHSSPSWFGRLWAKVSVRKR